MLCACQAVQGAQAGSCSGCITRLALLVGRRTEFLLPLLSGCSEKIFSLALGANRAATIRASTACSGQH